MSLPEVLLWRELRQTADAKFRRQHPLGPYVLDFYCAAAKLCIEIDGVAHEMGERPKLDAKRDEWLRGQGIEVVRIPAAEVLTSPIEVAEALIRHCRRKTPPSAAAAAATSPFALRENGEDQRIGQTRSSPLFRRTRGEVAVAEGG